MMMLEKEALEAPFAHLYAHGIRFSTLLADWIKYAGYSRADIAQHAGCADRSLKSCIQKDAAPTDGMRQAMIDCIGFDPWATALSIDRIRKPIRREDLITIQVVRQLESDVDASSDATGLLDWHHIEDEEKQ